MKLINDSKVMYIDQSKLTYLFPGETRQYKELITPEQAYNFVNYDGTEYYLKTCLLSTLLHELIGEALSEYFDLATVKNIIVSFDNPSSFGSYDYSLELFTKLFYEDGWTYTSLESFPDIVLDERNIGLKNLKRLNIFKANDGKRWRVLRSDQIAIRRSIKKMLIRDFLADQRDRHLGNYMFGYKDNRVKMMPLYDYEYSFDSYYQKYFNDFNLKLSQPEVVSYLRKDPYMQFLLKKAVALNMALLLKNLEQQYNLKLNNEERRLYIGGVNKRQRLILERKLIV